MIVYDRFWEMLKKRGITQYALVRKYKISGSTLQRIRKKRKFIHDNYCEIV